MTLPGDSEIRASARPRCYLCDRPGRPLYTGLADRLFRTAGRWRMVRCPDDACGLIWLDPMPLEEDIEKAYRHYYTHTDVARNHPPLLLRLFNAAKEGYLAQTYGYFEDSPPFLKRLAGWLIRLHPGRRAVFDFNVMWLKQVANGRLLDVGCGSGEFLRFMQRLGWRVEGVDFDAEAARNAGAKHVTVHVGSLEAQEFADDTFDAVTLSHFIEHVHDPRRLVEECHRILRPGGRLVIVTPNSASLGHRIYRENWKYLEPPRHLHLFNRNTLWRVAERAGFTRLESFTSVRDAYGMFMGSRSIKQSESYDIAGRQPPGVRLWARAMEFVEWLELKIKPEIGEELVLLAEK